MDGHNPSVEEWEQDRRRGAVSPRGLYRGAGSSRGRDEGMEMGQPARAGKAKGRQSRRRGWPAVHAARMGQGGGASPALAPVGLLGRRGKGITRLGREK